MEKSICPQGLFGVDKSAKKFDNEVARFSRAIHEQNEEEMK